MIFYKLGKELIRKWKDETWKDLNSRFSEIIVRYLRMIADGPGLSRFSEISVRYLSVLSRFVGKKLPTNVPKWLILKY